MISLLALWLSLDSVEDLWLELCFPTHCHAYLCLSITFLGLLCISADAELSFIASQLTEQVLPDQNQHPRRGRSLWQGYAGGSLRAHIL